MFGGRTTHVFLANSGEATELERSDLTKNQRRQFYNRLRKVKSKFNWYLSNEKAIRAIGNFCPITAICFANTEKYFGELEADQQYVDVGMPLNKNDRETIMDAADGGIVYVDNKKEVKVIRETMLRILELQA